MFDSNCVLCKERDEWKIEKKRRDDEEEEATARRQVEYQQQQWELEQMAREDKPKVSAVAVVKKKLSDEEQIELTNMLFERDRLNKEATELTNRIKTIEATPSQLANASTHCALCKKWFNDKTRMDQHIISKEHRIKSGKYVEPMYPRKCDVCDVMMKSKQTWDDHMNSKKHKVRTGQIQIVSDYPKQCQVCDYTANTRHLWEQHCAGAKHISKQTQVE